MRQTALAVTAVVLSAVLGAAAAMAAEPALPAGASNTLSESCRAPTVDLSSGDKRWTLSQGEKRAFTGPSDNWKIHCGNGFTGTSCPEGGHIRAIYAPGKVMFGCYEGAIPDDPFAD